MYSPLEPINPAVWDEGKARHLLNRAGFGVPHELVERLARLEPAAAVSLLVDYAPEADLPPEPEWLEIAPEMRAGRDELRRDLRRMRDGGGMDPAEQERIQQEFRKRRVELRRAQRENIERLKSWWFRRMMETPHPLQEKMTLFWHGHFATSAEKVRSPGANYDLNALFRAAGTGNFKLLTYEVCCSPAMMLNLDNARSRKEHPNENWARELMELYTLGQGKYSEEDIQAAARAFTGWSTDGETFAYRSGVHDHGEKSFMGHRGNLNGNDIFDIIFARPDTAEFIASKLWEFFAHEDPEPVLRRQLGMTLYRAGYELRPLLRKIFLSRAFYSERAMGTRIKSPVELLISMVDSLELSLKDDALVEAYLLFAMSRMGQNLFHAPSVKGWPGGRTWISAGTLMSRYNASSFLTQGIISEGGPELRRRVIRRFRDDPAFRRSLRQRRMQMRRGEGGSGMASTSMEDESTGADSGEGLSGFELPLKPLDVRQYFARYDGNSTFEVVEALAERFYVLPVNESQLREFVQALEQDAPGREVFHSGSWPEKSLRGTLHLMMSAAEFQLC